MVGWGESLLIWIPLPFTASINEIISLNIFAILTGAVTGFLASIIGLYLCNFIARKKHFGHEIHQTAWAFSFTVAIFLVAMVIGGIVGGSTLTRLVLAIFLAPITFFLAYQFSVLFLFKRRLAGRITFEVFIVLFILIYLIKNPGPPEEVPLTNPSHPHVFYLHIPELYFGSEGLPALSDCFPEKYSDNITEFKYFYASIRDPRLNILESFKLHTEDNRSLLDYLKDYDYHMGLFSIQKLPEEMKFKNFDIIDSQTQSLKSRHSLFNFYNKIIPFVDLNIYAQRLDGYPEAQRRDPNQLNERLLNMIKRNRDENPFFIFTAYAPVPASSRGTEVPGAMALKSLISSLDKMGILQDSYMIFTTFSKKGLRRPLILFSGNSFYDDKQQTVPVSQHDLSTTTASIISGINIKDNYSADLRDVAFGEIDITRPIYCWEDLYDPDSPAIMVCSYPWKLEQAKDGTYSLTNIEDDPEGKTNLVETAPEIYDMLLKLLSNPKAETQFELTVN